MRCRLPHRARIRSLGLATLGLAFASFATAAAASDWQQIGLSQRPSWVSANAERRLRLVPALRGIENTLRAQATGYFASNGPGMSVGLVLNDGLFYSRGFGFRDAAKTKTPDEDTVFCIGSFTKVFTGTTLLVLRDADPHHVDLDDPVSDYVSRINQVRPAPCPGGGCPASTVRLRHLVSHTAGLADEMSPAIVSESDWLDELQKSRFSFAPGKFSAYSGVGVELAGVVIARITNKKYTQAVTDRLLTPLGMTETTFDFNSIPTARRAQNYDLGWNQAYTAVHFTADSSWPDYKILTAAGYLLSNVRDLAKFDRMWIAEKAPGDILAPTTLAAARQPAVPASTTAVPGDCSSFTDGHGSYYSPCGDAAEFGVNWDLHIAPKIQHNGSIGRCGSNTVLDQDHTMGVTGLISTEPFPAVPSGHSQPAAVDGGFMYSVVNFALENAEVYDGATTSWQDQELAIGVARYLWVLGATLPSSGQSAFKQLFLSQFTPAYQTAHHLTTSTVAQYLSTQRTQIGACSTFRVRAAPSADEVTLRLKCAPGTTGNHTAFDATLTIEAAGSHRIAAITHNAPAVDPY